MVKRLILIALILLGALAVFTALGLRAINLHAEGLAARRSGEFIEVAQQIRLDVKRKLDAFLSAEQKRPYTDYQYYYAPDNVLQNEAVLISPIANTVSNGLAYGYFQIDSSGAVNSPHHQPGSSQISPPLQDYLRTVESELLPALDGRNRLDARRVALAGKPLSAGSEVYDQSFGRFNLPRRDVQALKKEDVSEFKKAPVGKGTELERSQRYKIQTFEQEGQQAQVITQSRAQVERNVENTARQGQYVQTVAPVPASPKADQYLYEQVPAGGMGMGLPPAEMPAQVLEQKKDITSRNQPQAAAASIAQAAPSEDIVQIRIEPFTPVIVPAADPQNAPVFGGDIYLLRHVQIEQNHILQGFRLDQTDLLAQIRESASRLIRSGMYFDIAPVENPAAAHSAILDFGFGDLVLNLFEADPGRLAAQIGRLRITYFAITSVVAAAVLMALLSLGRNLHAQLRLARKKDDFISAVSHELRTPLTSLRMYTEMLEKDWVASEDKRKEYYASMRQETERLSRLIENVLDFSRLQRKKKKFNFTLGDLNPCVQEAVRMFAPCAVRAGFQIRTELADLPPFAFDRDAVTQIVINLLDNAVKYAKDAADKTVTVRTLRRDKYILLEVEDRGPGIPRKFHGKVFEEFYRCADENTRETTGTGLGLALVRQFAVAHGGFADVLNARPRGAILQVAFAASPAPHSA
jgi:signal transduction histidine kinase